MKNHHYHLMAISAAIVALSSFSPMAAAVTLKQTRALLAKPQSAASNTTIIRAGAMPRNTMIKAGSSPPRNGSIAYNYGPAVKPSAGSKIRIDRNQSLGTFGQGTTPRQGLATSSTDAARKRAETQQQMLALEYAERARKEQMDAAARAYCLGDKKINC